MSSTPSSPLSASDDRPVRLDSPDAVAALPMRTSSEQAAQSSSPVTRETLSRASILVVGDVMLDRYWFGDVNRISPEAPVPVVLAQRIEERLGGAANVARNIAALGAHGGLLCVIGNDEPGQRIIELLAESKVEAHIERDASLPTTIKLRVLARQQQLLRVDFESSPGHEVLLTCLDRFDALLPNTGVVVLSDYAKGGLTHVGEMIRRARAAGKAVLVDPKGSDWARYRGASLLTPNRAELQQVIGGWSSEAELNTKVDALRADLGVDALLLTRSEDGMTLFTAQPSVSVPAQAREVYDVSGAGDTVIATLAVMLGAGLPLFEAMRLANRAGGIVVGKLGTATVEYDELFPA